MITIEEALYYVRALEKVTEPYGFHCALAGGVLHKGYSHKDLDIIIYPHKAPSFAEALLMEVFPQAKRCESYGEKIRDDKVVYNMQVDGIGRVDLFFLT